MTSLLLLALMAHPALERCKVPVVPEKPPETVAVADREWLSFSTRSAGNGRWASYTSRDYWLDPRTCRLLAVDEDGGAGLPVSRVRFLVRGDGSLRREESDLLHASTRTQLVSQEVIPDRAGPEPVGLRWGEQPRQLADWRVQVPTRRCTSAEALDDATLDSEVDGERVVACFEEFSGGAFEKRQVARTAEHVAELWVLPFRNSTAVLRINERSQKKRSAWSGWVYIALQPELRALESGVFEVSFRDFEGRQEKLVVDPQRSQSRVVALAREDPQ